jgi:hypothetical protein
MLLAMTPCVRAPSKSGHWFSVYHPLRRMVAGMPEAVMISSVALWSGARYTADLHAQPDLELRPLTRPNIGRQIDALARPETLERANVKAVLARIRTLAAGLAGRG